MSVTLCAVRTIKWIHNNLKNLNQLSPRCFWSHYRYDLWSGVVLRKHNSPPGLSGRLLLSDGPMADSTGSTHELTSSAFDVALKRFDGSLTVGVCSSGKLGFFMIAITSAWKTVQWFSSFMFQIGGCHVEWIPLSNLSLRFELSVKIR